MDGVLNINKPSGMTSHDVVLQVRRVLKEKRVGHTGTLDPSATGVLVLCIGKATRVAQHLEAGEKQYQTVMRLGVTQIRSTPMGKFWRLGLMFPRAVPGSRGAAAVPRNITQTPPAYSAIKSTGRPVL